MSKCDFNKIALQFYRNRTSAWVFPSKFAVFSEHLFLRALLDKCSCIHL